MKITFLILISLFLVHQAQPAEKPPAKDPLLYLKHAQAKDSKLEVLDLYLDEEGSLHNGSMKYSFADCRKNFTQWRKTGGQDPLVILYLYPSLPSNNDWKRLREMAAFFDEEKVPWQFGIYSGREPVPKNLHSKSSKKKFKP